MISKIAEGLLDMIDGANRGDITSKRALNSHLGIDWEDAIATARKHNVLENEIIHNIDELDSFMTGEKKPNSASAAQKDYLHAQQEKAREILAPNSAKPKWSFGKKLGLGLGTAGALGGGAYLAYRALNKEAGLMDRDYMREKSKPIPQINVVRPKMCLGAKLGLGLGTVGASGLAALLAKKYYEKQQ